MSRRLGWTLAAVAAIAAIAGGSLLAARQMTGGSTPGPGSQGLGLYRGSEPPAGIRLPAFSLRDVVNGERIDSERLRGRVVLVTFLDSDCTHQCPIIAGEIGRALRLLPADVSAQTSALALSVNPEIDTRASVVRFLRERRAEEMTYLSGALAELQPVWRRFNIVSAYETGDADTHSADVRIFDPQGVWVSTLHVGVDLTPANLAHDVRMALEKGA
jgi:cytochrome oxidase Cu insertion factor (SCO1/SenC/PrrC family)